MNPTVFGIVISWRAGHSSFGEFPEGFGGIAMLGNIPIDIHGATLVPSPPPVFRLEYANDQMTESRCECGDFRLASQNCGMGEKSPRMISVDNQIIYSTPAYVLQYYGRASKITIYPYETEFLGASGCPVSEIWRLHFSICISTS